MVEPINLRKFRKQKKRKERAIHAEENCHRFGRTKLEKLFDKKETLKAKKFLDQNLISSDE
ncbi:MULTISPECIES: DUF4169 family protein [unclassified Bartonella]|uniref:DUF4169 family protein n=1 Tax=unclassified Bartonella TaxID=2645622 RepID=UPI00099B220E|nr:MULTISPECIES: DUF4169 family protein [unclassified Bartonella]AQX28231.1 hypothetical protein BJB15x_008400 [Bartonella sp. JB15]AQX29502.1 protein of unknown function (DUF4169) [Bartonella sp. JB63]